MTGARLLAVVVALSGCTRTFQAEVVEPNPVAHPTETLRESEPIKIVTGQMGLEVPEAAGGLKNASYVRNHRYPLINQAQFVVVSRDRLRFHVQIDHTWDEYADLKTWDAKLEDDQGHVWQPEALERAHHRLMTRMWDREQRTSVCDSRGRDVNGDCYNIVGFEDDGWRNRMPLGNVTVYRGTADLVFYQRDIMSPRVRWMKLTLHRSGEDLEFTWRFEDDVASS